MEWKELVRRFDEPGVLAIAVLGSYARGEAGPYSDVDLARFTTDTATPPDDPATHLIDKRLVVVQSVPPRVVEGWFTRPEEAVKVVGGLRRGRALLDRHGTFATIQARAHAFTWDTAMQARAAAYTSAQMVGWIEEVHKGLEGLRRDDIGRLLNARYGLSWGLSDVVQVHRGVLVSGDNGVWDEIEQAVGSGTEWAVVRRAAFGIEAPGGDALPLRDHVRAGLRLYVLTARLLGATLAPRDAELVAQTVSLIEQTLAP